MSDWRTLYCKTFRCFWHRDVMASKNMNNSVKDHLIHQQRPLYLQPRRHDGTYPWMGIAAGGGSGGDGGGRADRAPAEAMNISEDGAGGSGGGGGAAAVVVLGSLGSAQNDTIMDESH